MKILRRHRTWLDTHFVTDCVRLPTHRMGEILQLELQRAVEPIPARPRTGALLAPGRPAEPRLLDTPSASA